MSTLIIKSSMSLSIGSDYMPGIMYKSYKVTERVSPSAYWIEQEGKNELPKWYDKFWYYKIEEVAKCDMTTM